MERIRRRVLEALNEDGEDLLRIVLKEFEHGIVDGDITDIEWRYSCVKFTCSDRKMLSLLSTLRDAINVTVYIDRL